MKILFIRSASKISGAEKYNIYLLAELKKYIHVLLLSNLQDFKKSSIPFKYCSWLPVEVGTKKQLLWVLLYFPVFIIRYLFECQKFELICLESRTEMIFLTPFLKIFHKKVVWIQHGPLFIPGSSKLINALYLSSSFLVNKIIAVSEDTKNNLIGWGIAKEKIECIYIGIDIPRLKNIRKPFIVGYLGTVTKEKGIDEFIKSVIRAKIPALVIGDGPDRHLIPKTIPCTGYVDDIGLYLRKVSLLFMPTRHYEGISLAYLEAMSMGIPVMTTDIGGNREIIKDNITGKLIKSGETIHWNQKWKQMGLNAHFYVKKHFNIKIQAKKFNNYFRSI